MNKFINLLATGTIVTVVFIGQATADTCLSAKGKIKNNAQPGGTTLGVASLKLKGRKYKCAVHGVSLPQDIDPATPDFRHTIVCDNRTSSGEAQAQVTLNTFFTSAPEVMVCPEGGVSFSFEEISFPDPSSARGDFVGMTDMGSIVIKGNLNCAGGINMKFKGELCFSKD